MFLEKQTNLVTFAVRWEEGKGIRHEKKKKKKNTRRCNRNQKTVSLR